MSAPDLLVPYPEELVRPAGAPDLWAPPTTEELGWRALPADATPDQRARAESVWRAVATDRPCRCSGKCQHGQPCTEDGCSGRIQHYDRLAASLLSAIGWYDFYTCDGCRLWPQVELVDTAVRYEPVPPQRGRWPWPPVPRRTRMVFTAGSVRALVLGRDPAWRPNLEVWISVTKDD